ncbi:MAG: tRNA methyl transferase PRC-barrel domain-containing protein, partial [Acutalibacteraceae bacterium]|nr:tRNA methyl transferase PRC-barrel domain-containing protein [Acutalibacteraceae bacterium]
LYSLTQHQLSHLLLPLGGLSKAQIREKAEKSGLVNANRPDSQDICFVPDGDYASFIEKTDGFVSSKGDYVDINGAVLGKHEGIINYTIGQRKGLGIALGKPQFVIDKNADTNTVILGDEEHLFKTEVLVKDVNFIPFDRLEEEMKIKAKLRYRHKESPCVISPLENGKVKIVFSDPQRAPSAGQAAVFYDGDTVVGGGKII